jgi:putative transcriptional regulator
MIHASNPEGTTHMAPRIVNRFRILLAEKETREKRHIPLTEVQRETGIAWTTLQAWANNEVQRFDAPVMAALCEYLGCEVGDLLRVRNDIC